MVDVLTMMPVLHRYAAQRPQKLQPIAEYVYCYTVTTFLGFLEPAAGACCVVRRGSRRSSHTTPPKTALFGLLQGAPKAHRKEHAQGAIRVPILMRGEGELHLL